VQQTVSILWATVPDDLVIPWLPAEELAAIARYRRPADRAARLATRAMVRRAVGGRLGTAPRDLQLTRDPCLRCHGPHGRVVVPGSGVRVSLSHTDGLAVVALSTDGNVGVDAERIRSLSRVPSLSERILVLAEQRALDSIPEDEASQALLGVWVRKEAVLKCTGHGLTIDPRDVVVDPLSPGLQCSEGPEGSGPIYSEMVALGLSSHVAAVATTTAPEVEVVRLLHGDLADVGLAA